MTKYSKGIAQIIIPIILALIVFIGIGYFAIKNGQLKPNSSNSQMNELTLALCDLDANGHCDSTDLVLFQQALGKSRGDPYYNPLADANTDGVITDADQQILFPTSSPTGNYVNWKTYSHKNPSFEFKYPESLEVSISDNANPNRDFYYLFIGFIPKGSDPTSYSIVSLDVLDKYNSVDDYLDNQWCNTKTAELIKNTTLDGYPAKEIYCSNASLPNDSVVSKKDKYIYQVFVNYGDAHKKFYSKEETKILFDQILSTFHFLD